MIDFWIAVMLTGTVALLTILVNWLASMLVSGARTLQALREIVQAGLSSSDVQPRIREELERYNTARRASLAWGADLATVAISMDFVALGIWIHSHSFFPFFSRFNTQTVSREIPVWLIVIGVHFVSLIGSLVLKHSHAELTARAACLAEERPRLARSLADNGWMLAANSLGFMTLLSCIVVFTNAV